MTAINTIVASTTDLVTSSAASQTAESTPTADANDTSVDFGAATTLSLSPPAQAIVTDNAAPAAAPASPSSPATASDTTAPAGGSAPAGKSGGGAPIASTTTTEAELIAEAKRKAAAQVGVAEAANVVDNKGNINHAAIARIVAEQAAKNRAAS